MNNRFRLTLAAACLGTIFGVTAAQAQTQQSPSPGYGMWQQLTPDQQKQMWENMQRGGYGPGYGMMGGYGPGYGMGPGMMGGWSGLNLSESQLAQSDKIHEKLQEKHRKLMSQMWEEQAKLADLYNAEKRDPAAIGKAHDKLAKLQREALNLASRQKTNSTNCSPRNRKPRLAEATAGA